MLTIMVFIQMPTFSHSEILIFKIQVFKFQVLYYVLNTTLKGIHIHCCAVPCSAAHDPFDHFEIRTNLNLKIIEQITCCTARCCAAVDLDPIEGPTSLSDSEKMLLGKMHSYFRKRCFQTLLLIF
jgi:hypothetical protein